MIPEDRELLGPMFVALSNGIADMFRESHFGGADRPVEPRRYEELSKRCLRAAAVLYEIAERRATPDRATPGQGGSDPAALGAAEPDPR